MDQNTVSANTLSPVALRQNYKIEIIEMFETNIIFSSICQNQVE